MKKNAPPLRSFRLVCRPQHISLVEELLKAEGYDFTPEPFSLWCRKLTHEPAPLGGSLAALFGCIYIQDRSSMLPPLALNPPTGAAVLDMCASPGGKASFCAQLTGPTGFVLANEPTRARLNTLRANLHTLGLLHIGTCAYPGETLPLIPASWQWIQLDPPCSGWGTAQKHPQIHTLWHGKKIKPLVALQVRLLERAALLLAPGGVLVYSTCTTNEDENEAQIRYAVNELGFTVEPLQPFEGFVWEPPHSGGEGTLRVDGVQSNAQGFYIARLRAPGSMPHSMPCPEPCQKPHIEHGTLTAFGTTARLVPQQAQELLPAALQWQAAAVGKIVDEARVRLHSRTRILLPDIPPADAFVADDTATLRALCNGQCVRTDKTVRETGLYWRGLPLGRIRIKNGRVVWNPHA